MINRYRCYNCDGYQSPPREQGTARISRNFRQKNHFVFAESNFLSDPVIDPVRGLQVLEFAILWVGKRPPVQKKNHDAY